MSDLISLRNTDKTSEYQVRANDGSSFQIQPGATVHNVDPKFNYNLPPAVKVVIPNTVPVEENTTRVSATVRPVTPLSSVTEPVKIGVSLNSNVKVK